MLNGIVILQGKLSIDLLKLTWYDYCIKIETTLLVDYDAEFAIPMPNGIVILQGKLSIVLLKLIWYYYGIKN